VNITNQTTTNTVTTTPPTTGTPPPTTYTGNTTDGFTGVNFDYLTELES
jgi:hypothetical protein